MLTEAQSLQTAAFPESALELDDTVTAVTVILNRDVDPALIDVVGGEQSKPKRQPTAPPRPEYINADLDDRGKC
jgi:hypothetical protein